MESTAQHAAAEPSPSSASPRSSPADPTTLSDPRTPPHPPPTTTRRTSAVAHAQQQLNERRSSTTQHRRQPQHPALLDAHTHRSNNLDLLESLDDETLAALANELREIGLGRAGAGAGAGAGSGGGASGARSGTGQGGETAQGRSMGGSRPLRRATTTGTPAERERARCALSGSSSPSRVGPPPAYSPVDPLRRLATTGLRSTPLAVVHERRMSAPSGERWSG
ncbi:hypothetical protein JCM8208_006898 [Rhodotorula glutinis]